MRRWFVGFAAGMVGSVSVGRALDLKKPAKGKIYLPDPENDPTLVKGIGTDFTNEKVYMVGGLLVLPSVNNAAANTEIAEIISDEEIRMKKPFKGDVAYKQLTGKEPSSDGTNGANGHMVNGDVEDKDSGYEGTKFSVAPHVDQSKVYEAVFQRLKEGGCIGIFPEGGSHDRTELLPLKAGVAIMALGALAENPDCGVKIIPVGMNYFHPHKFRSRAVIEFGKEIEIEPELVEMYKTGNRREAVQTVLDTVTKGLQSVTTLAPDYETLMLIQAVRRLYNPKGKSLPLSMVVELNRRLMKGYATYKDDPRVVKLRNDVLDYNKTLFRINIRDHQVGYSRHPWYKAFYMLIERVCTLLVLSVAVIPGVVLFAPVFIAGKIISRQKSKEALAASTVKIKARDVIATWKILVTLALTPVLDITYTSILTWLAYYNRVWGYLPGWVPLWLVAMVGLVFFPAVCFMALRFGENGMDIAKSLRPLFLCINPNSSDGMVKLERRREDLIERINNLINELGPELFPDFDSQRIIQDSEHPLHSPERSRPSTPTQRRDGSEIDALTFTPASPPSAHRSSYNGPAPTTQIPRNESFKNIGSIGLFASRPSTPNRSRSRTNSGSDSHFGSGLTFGSNGKLHGFTALTPAQPESAPKADLDEVSRNLHAAMRERGRRRKSTGEAENEEGWELDRDRSVTPYGETEDENRLTEEPAVVEMKKDR